MICPAGIENHWHMADGWPADGWHVIAPGAMEDHGIAGPFTEDEAAAKLKELRAAHPELRDPRCICS